MDWACNSCKQLHLLLSDETINHGIDSIVCVYISDPEMAIEILSKNVQFPS